MKVKITIFILFFYNAIAIAQDTITISYNESINLGEIEAKTQFLITSKYKNFKLKGDKINSFTFQKPGIYQIKVIENKKIDKDNCDHNQLPNNIIVNVSRIKMTFLGNRITLSEPILKNKETNGITLSIPIQIQTFDHQPIQLNTLPINSAGIGTKIKAKLNKKFNELPEGDHIISYDLNGTAHENSYLMFDFIDANDKVQSIALQAPITN